MRITAASLKRLRLPLLRPYRLSYRTFEEFEPFLVEIEASDGRVGFADAHISPGSSEETREGGWAFCRNLLEEAIGAGPQDAQAAVARRFEESKVAATAVTTALEMLEGRAAVRIDRDTAIPLLAPVNETEPTAIAEEIAQGIAAGYRTFKVKVGKDVAADLARVAAVQAAAGGQASLRLDANRAFSRDAALAFVAGLDPAAIELFEQPCAAEDWDANAAVAAASPVPLMLDEPICTLADIDRAARLPNVGFCKLKLKRFGGLGRLREGLLRVRERGMTPVLGDGLGSDLHNFLEAAAACGLVDNAGEFNGFLKMRDRLLAPSMPFRDGAIQLPAGFEPVLDRDAIAAATIQQATFGRPS